MKLTSIFLLSILAMNPFDAVGSTAAEAVESFSLNPEESSQVSQRIRGEMEGIGHVLNMQGSGKYSSEQILQSIESRVGNAEVRFAPLLELAGSNPVSRVLMGTHQADLDAALVAGDLTAALAALGSIQDELQGVLEFVESPIGGFVVERMAK